jgi:BatD DUF11 like domain
MKKIVLIISILAPLSIWGQKNGSFNVAVSGDTVGLNGSIEVTFTLENVSNKQFTPPSFDGFEAQGPSTSMMTSITNGAMTQSTSYTFYLTPRSVGRFKIPSVSMDTEGGTTMKTEEKTIVVVEHYDAKIRPKQRSRGLFDSDDDFFFRRPTPPQAPEKPKKKYPTEKI